MFILFSLSPHIACAVDPGILGYKKSRSEGYWRYQDLLTAVDYYLLDHKGRKKVCVDHYFIHYTSTCLEKIHWYTVKRRSCQKLESETYGVETIFVKRLVISMLFSVCLCASVYGGNECGFYVMLAASTICVVYHPSFSLAGPKG